MNGSAVLSSHSTLRAQSFTAIQALFKRFTHGDLCTRWTVKGLQVTIVHLALQYLNGGYKLRL